jgi:hypothetical protein
MTEVWFLRALPFGLGSILAFALLPGSAVYADEYPFSGLFWPSSQEAIPKDVAAQCALTFLEQKSDGSWSVYHVDLEEFESTGTITYYPLANGQCTFDAKQKIETCSVQADKSFPEGVGTVVFDIVTRIDDDIVETLSFADRASVMRAVLDPQDLESGIRQDYLRCPYPDARLLSYRSSVMTNLSKEELNALRFPSEEVVSSQTVARLVEALRKE